MSEEQKRLTDQQLAEIVAAVQLVPDHTKTLSAIWHELRRAATQGAKLQHYAERQKLVGEKIDLRQFAMMILPMTGLDLVLDMRKVAEELMELRAKNSELLNLLQEVEATQVPALLGVCRTHGRTISLALDPALSRVRGPGEFVTAEEKFCRLMLHQAEGCGCPPESIEMSLGTAPWQTLPGRGGAEPSAEGEGGGDRPPG